MKAKWKFVFSLIVSVGLIVVIIFSEINNWTAIGTLAGILVSIAIEILWRSAQDLADVEGWQKTQRKLKRGSIINEDTIVRISFAYLFRIKMGNYYLLVPNSRNTGKYQPVGGVYKMTENEKTILKNRFQVKDDDKIPIDESSKDDYRLRMENRYLRRFVRRFDKKADRERINNVGREFKEELVNTGIIGWNEITYRYCGRHISDLHFSEHFQTYELLLADIVELLPTMEQEKDLKKLLDKSSEQYHFATAPQIECLGTNTETGDLREWIGDHTKKILQENEGTLIILADAKKTFTVKI